MSEQSTILKEEENPFENYAAVVESDNRTVYLYLLPTKNENLPAHAVWLRNLVPAPDEPDRDSIKEGRPPLMHVQGCNHPEGALTYNPQNLDFVWFPEGNGVTLYNEGKLEAILPTWSGRENVSGYSKEALGYQSNTLPLPPENSAIYTRLQENLDFWDRRTRPEDWNEFRDQLLNHFESLFGKHSQYYALTDVKFPTLAVLEFALETGILYCSLGMSRQPMPGIELLKSEPEHFVRREIFLFSPNPGSPGAPDDYANMGDALNQIRANYPGLVGRLARYPWIVSAALDHGHLFESGMATNYCDFIFSESPAPTGLSSESMAGIMEHYNIEGHSLSPLFALPATQEDLLVARQKGADFWLDKRSRSAGS
ncbi:MAG: hypothetical protein CMN76_19520 [Spirochaetaceae bacterium]|nr:hypothetical protein [Spirochaetaceae bacterium]|tara:strand:+ start:57202 stop:58308 length:1107 start_codon:yes stop_codon:yes gene_type:complete